MLYLVVNNIVSWYHVFILFPYSSKRPKRWSYSWSSHLGSSRYCGGIAARNHINEKKVSLNINTTQSYIMHFSCKPRTLPYYTALHLIYDVYKLIMGIWMEVLLTKPRFIVIMMLQNFVRLQFEISWYYTLDNHWSFAGALHSQAQLTRSDTSLTTYIRGI